MDVRLEAAEIADLAVDLASQVDPEQARDHIIRRARWTFGSDAVTMMARAGGRDVVSAKPEEAVHADELQLATGEGPCLSAAREGRIVISEDLRSDPRWPTWGPRVAELGWQASLSTPLRFSSENLGALNLYSRKPTRFDQTFIDAVDVFAAQAATTLALLMHSAQLRQAITTRHLIGQAQGILMQQRDLDADQAFQLLKEHSQNHNVKLHDVAAVVVDTRSMPAPSRRRRPRNLPTSG